MKEIDRLKVFGFEYVEDLDENEKVEVKALQNLKNELKETSSILYFKPIINLDNEEINPDMLWIHPHIGILVIEVKAWDVDFIKNGEWLDTGQFKGKNGTVYSDPQKQVRRYVEKIMNKIKTIAGSKGQPLPVSYIIYFPNITEKAYDKYLDESFKEKFPKRLCLFKFEKKVIDKFISRLEPFKIINVLKEPISETEFEPIRRALFPHLSISKFNLKVTEKDIPILDLYQESILHTHKEGYKILRGTAGSGKTVILASKAIYEKLKYPKKKILVISFANPLVNEIKTSIEQIIKVRNLNISIDDFDIETIDSLINTLYEKYISDEVSSDFIEKKNRFLMHLKNNSFYIQDEDKYDVILCDESQDLEKDMFEVIKALSKKSTITIFGVDETQRIYDNRDWRWIDVGYDARGRVYVLKRCYRNPGNILNMSISFLRKDPRLLEELKELNAVVVEENIVPMREDNEKVEFYIVENEFIKVKEIVKDLLNNNIPPSDIFILTPTEKLVKYYANNLKKIMSDDHIHFFSSNSEKINKYIPNDKLVIMPYKSAKGLERPIVIVTGVHLLPYNSSEKVNEKRRDRKTLYVALTRAQRKLIITAQKEEGFAKDLREIIVKSLSNNAKT